MKTKALTAFAFTIFGFYAQSLADERVDSWLERMDADKDGALAPGETSGLMKQYFGRSDGNSDGKLDKAELEALSKRLGQNRQRPAAQGRNGGAISDDAVRSRVPEGVEFLPNLAYREGDASQRWKLDLFHPKAKSKAKRPAIVFVHGGGWRSGDKRRGTFLQGAIDYAAKGYVTITVNYRLTGTDPFPACVEDVKCAVRWLRANAEKYHLDPDRIGAYGNSAGAHLVCMLGMVKNGAGLEGDGGNLDPSSLVQAVCASATPADFVYKGKAALERMGRKGSLLDEPSETLEERGKLASPVTHVSADAPPMLLVHGDSDRTVSVKDSDRLNEALKKAGAKDVTYMRIEGAGHGVFNQHKAKTYSAMEAFFARVLKGEDP